MHLGLDLGTSELKALLLDDDGQVVAQAGAPLTVSRPRPLWSEQAPADWWAATESAVAQIRQRAPKAFAALRSIGLAGQMHGAVVLDAADQVLRPAILWNDGRSHAECEELTQRAPSLHAVAANLAMPGFTAPKLLWLRRHEPEHFARLRSVLLPKDWLRLQLTGEKVSDPSDAAGTLWLDVAARDWSDALLAACGLERHQMPWLVESGQPSGQLRADIARAWGLAQPVVVAGGAGDNAASAIGIGATEPGQGFVSLGTSGVIFVADDHARTDAASTAAAVHTFCHALPARWHRMSVMLSAASCLSWFTRFTGAADEATLLAELETLAEAERDTAPLFLPYLAGERTPHNDPFAPALFHGLTHAHGRAAATHAVLEGVAFGLADGLDALRRSGTAPQALWLVGGGARSARWAALIADALDTPLLVPAGAEAGAALGAARLGRMAAGAAPQQVCMPPPVGARHEPDPLRQRRLAPRRAQFHRLCTRLLPSA